MGRRGRGGYGVCGGVGGWEGVDSGSVGWGRGGGGEVDVRGPIESLRSPPYVCMLLVLLLLLL